MAANTTSDVKTLARIINSDAISKHFRQQYPSVNQLLDWNIEQTAATLSACGAIQLFKLDQWIRYEQHGTDNLKTWSDYQQGIHQYLKSLNDDRRLEAAREVLANHIHDVHLKKFPRWPTVADMKQQSEVFIDISSSYPFDNYWYVGWSCLGYITVQDFRANASSYYTDFHGNPEFKILYCNERKLKEFEQLARSDMQEARRLIQGNSKSLTWDDLKRLTSS